MVNRSAVARHARRAFILLTVAPLFAYAYYALRSHAWDGPLLVAWLPALSLLINGLYLLVFAPEEAAIYAERHRWLGFEPIIRPEQQRRIQWAAAAQMVTAIIVLALWWPFDHPS